MTESRDRAATEAKKLPLTPWQSVSAESLDVSEDVLASARYDEFM